MESAISQVKYEFTSYSGMQLVMAWFTPIRAGRCSRNWSRPSVHRRKQNSAKGSAPADTQALWQLPHGERVVYDGPKRFVAVLGPGGGPLKQDAAENEALDSP